MQTQLWRPNVGIAELGEDNLFHLGADGLEPITMVLVEIRRGRSLDRRLELGRRIVDICGELLGVPKRTVLVEFTGHSGDEILRDGEWAGDWTAAEASAERPATFVLKRLRPSSAQDPPDAVSAISGTLPVLRKEPESS